MASDDPDQISSILLLRGQIAGVQQTQENLANAGPIQLLDTANTLATQAATGTSDVDQRQQIAPQVQAILGQLVSLSQTAVNGHYVFNGDQDQQVAYTLNAAGNGVQQNITPGPPGHVGLTAQQIFDNAPDNVSASLQNDDTNGIQQALDNIKAASSYLNNKSSFYGAVQNRITNANTSAGQILIDLQKQLSDKQDADIVQASLDLNSALTNEQAALAAQAKLKPQSLFDYLG